MIRTATKIVVTVNSDEELSLGTLQEIAVKKGLDPRAANISTAIPTAVPGFVYIITGNLHPVPEVKGKPAWSLTTDRGPIAMNQTEDTDNIFEWEDQVWQN